MAMESNIYALWAGKQPAKGTPNTAGTKRLIQVAGDLEVQRADASEAFSDLDRYGNQTDYVNTIMGAGSPGIEGQSDILAYLCWLYFGGETFTAGTNSVHTMTMTGTPTGGTVSITIGTGASTGVATAVPYNSTAAGLATILNAMPNIAAAGGVTTGGGPWPGTPLTVTFGQPTPISQSQFAINNTALTGGASPAATDVITTPAAMAKHVFIPQPNGGFFSSAQARVGSSVIRRQQFSDILFASLAIEGSTANKVLRVTPTITSVTPGLTYAADPTTVINLANIPFLYTDGAGTFNVDGNIFQGQTQFNITWEQAFTPAYGDSVTPYDLVPGTSRITCAITLIVDTQGYQEYNRIIYGNPNPSPGTAPLKTLPALGSYSCNLNKASGEGFNAVVPGMHWAPGLSIPPNPAGGLIDISLAGEMRKVQGLPGSTVTVLNPDNAAYTT